MTEQLRLSPARRARMWNLTTDLLEQYLSGVDALPVQSLPVVSELAAELATFDFRTPMDPEAALRQVFASMTKMQTHVSHRRYFGLFNPAPTSIGIAADALVAGFNPNLAAWSHSPYAVAVEEHLVREIGAKFAPGFQWGSFTSGGNEANLTAFLCAMTLRFPAFRVQGLRSLPKLPTAYISAAAHHSLVKAGTTMGLGVDAIRIAPCDETLGMDIGALEAAIDADRNAGNEPFFVVATAGATATGIVERIEAIADVAKRNNLWLHIDAAWGGLAAIVPELRPSLAGIERADSITFDPHKSMGVPMGAGLFLTQHSDILGETFSVNENYMPPRNAEGDRTDPFIHSLQWSRRFIGLKVLLSLAVAGWDGYVEALRHQLAMAGLLRAKLLEAGYTVVNPTVLPLACFRRDDPSFSADAIAERVVRSGRAWISPTRLPDGTAVLRACITNYLTGETDVQELVDALTDDCIEARRSA